MPAARASRIRKTWLFIATPRRRLSDAASLDHLVRAQKQRLRDCEAECPGGLQVDDNIELSGLLDREIAWLRALENLVHVASGTTVEVGKVHSIGHQTPKFHRLANGERAWQPSAGCKVHDKSSIGVDARRRRDEERLGAGPADQRERF